MDYDVQVENNIIEREMTYQSTLILRYKINYPQFRSEAFRQAVARINRYYRARALAFRQYCERRLFPMAVEDYRNSIANGYPVHVYEAQDDYTVTYLQNCALSLFFDRYEYTGGAHGTTARSSETWDLQTGRRITLGRLFPPGVNERDFVIREVNRQIAEQIQNGNNIYFDNYQQLVEQTFDPASFFLTPEGAAVYFQQYDIAPYSSGIPVFLIPYSTGPIRQPSCRRV